MRKGRDGIGEKEPNLGNDITNYHIPVKSLEIKRYVPPIPFSQRFKKKINKGRY